MKQIIPAILTKDIEDLRYKIDKLQELTDWVQIDIMDGEFVNNYSISIDDLAKINTSLNIELHLMVLNPDKYLEKIRNSNIKRIIFHLEADSIAEGVIVKIKDRGFECGLAINPKTSIEKIKPYLPEIDLILLLGVSPGFGGQKFDQSIISKIKTLKKLCEHRVFTLKIGVDGGINLSNIKEIAQAGADYLIVGSNLFNAPDIKKRFKQLRQQII